MIFLCWGMCRCEFQQKKVNKASKVCMPRDGAGNSAGKTDYEQKTPNACIRLTQPLLSLVCNSVTWPVQSTDGSRALCAQRIGAIEELTLFKKPAAIRVTWDDGTGGASARRRALFTSFLVPAVAIKAVMLQWRKGDCLQLHAGNGSSSSPTTDDMNAIRT